jgi:hypothetical protein
MGLVFAALLFTNARAQSVDDFSPEARAAFVDWNKCLAGYVQARTATNERPEDVASAALRLCETQERVATEMLGKDFGAEGSASAIR